MSRQRFAIDVSPPVFRGVTEIDTSVFRKSVPVLAAKVPPVRAGVLLKAEELRGSIINIPKAKSVASAPDGDRLVLFRYSDPAALSPEALKFLKSQSAELVTHTLDLDYDYWTADDILGAVLPEELLEGAPSGFASVGHIAHVNLNPEYLPYKHLIGRLILEKNNSIKTVVNKLETINNQYRVFDMELLAGEPNYVVEHNESNCRFTFDFTEVYWNSRLHTEHARLVDQFSPEDVIADVFAGVGPFAVPAAKKGCAVFANDLNPNSYKYLVKNIKDNKVTNLVRPSCQDGRAFIRQVFNAAFDDPLAPVPPPRVPKSQRQRADRAKSPAAPAARRKRITHLAMNLPESAIEFLDAFRGVLSPENAGDRDLSGVYDAGMLPMVHCYCFCRELAAEKDIRQRVEARLGHAVGETELHFVRSVAPNKDMYCISFRLPPEVAYAA